MKRLILSVAILLSLSSETHAQNGGPIAKPVRYTWIAESCESWNCAAAAFVLANGDKHVIVVPTGHDQRPWLILRRVEEGSIFIPEDELFGCDVFDSVTVATARLSSMDACRLPLVLSVPDGRVLVASLAACDAGEKRRSVR